MKIKLNDNDYVSLYSDMAEAFLEDTFVGEMHVIAANGDQCFTEAAQDRYMDICNIVENVLEQNGIVQIDMTPAEILYDAATDTYRAAGDLNQSRECREPVVQTEFKRTTKSILSKSVETEEYITIMAENYDDLCKLYFKSYDNRSKYNNNLSLEILDDKFKDKYKIWISDVSNYANNGGDMF
tara:strand:+ start:160 stop:708 length:549 start_codon:yes stop_codon:yes gene_type:complete